jgi:hypothetical protein
MADIPKGADFWLAVTWPAIPVSPQSGLAAGRPLRSHRRFQLNPALVRFIIILIQ